MERNRVRFLRIMCLFVPMLVIVARLFYIQIIQHDDYVKQASDEHVSESVIKARRGEIYMMDGEDVVPVVLNETVYTVVFDPMNVDEGKAKEIFDKYAKENLIAKWEDVFRDKTRRYYIVARGIKYETAKKIVNELVEKNVVGITFEKTTQRVYPEGELASGLLGFVNVDGEGKYGVEESFDKELSGIDGNLKAVRDVSGVVLSIGDENVETPAVDGENVVLSIDRNIQSRVEKILSDHVEKTPATNASAIVMNPRNGKILAMANVPTYNPAKYADIEDLNLFRNYAADEPYETASVCKTFVFAAAMDLGLMTADTTYYNAGSMTVDGLTFNNAYQGLYGTITMQQGFNYSLNTSSATALKLMSGGSEINETGRQKLYDYYQKFRLGKETGIEIYEDTGSVTPPNGFEGDNYALNFKYANMTFGQGMSLTMVQVASAFSGLINNGYYNTPSILANSDTSREQIISESASQQVRNLLYGTRNSRRINGTDKAGYFVGGKTGTGQVVLENGQYSDAATGETIASYVGFGGREGELPEYVVVVKLWGDGRRLEGEKHALPLFDDINTYLIDYLKIRPNV